LLQKGPLVLALETRTLIDMAFCAHLTGHNLLPNQVYLCFPKNVCLTKNSKNEQKLDK